jgi:hypothetical protein
MSLLLSLVAVTVSVLARPARTSDGGVRTSLTPDSWAVPDPGPACAPLPMFTA